MSGLPPDIDGFVGRLRQAAATGWLEIEHLHHLARAVDDLAVALIAAMFENGTVTTWNRVAHRFAAADPHQIYRVPTSSTGLHRRYGEAVSVRRLKLAYYRSDHPEAASVGGRWLLPNRGWVIEHHRDLLEGLRAIGRHDLLGEWDAVIARYRRQEVSRLRLLHARVGEMADGTLVTFDQDGRQTSRVTTWRTLRPLENLPTDPVVVDRLRTLIDQWPER
jgi:hypothetical protein